MLLIILLYLSFGLTYTILIFNAQRVTILQFIISDYGNNTFDLDHTRQMKHCLKAEFREMYLIKKILNEILSYVHISRQLETLLQGSLGDNLQDAECFGPLDILLLCDI